MKLVTIGACAAAAALSCSSAWAGDYYVGGALSAAFQPPFTTTSQQLIVSPSPSPVIAGNNGTFIATPGGLVSRRISIAPTRVRTDFRPGIEADILFGRRFSLGVHGALRAEVEFGFRDYQVGVTTISGVPGAAVSAIPQTLKTTGGLQEQRWAETANLFYDFPTFKGVTPYLGGGIGYQEGVQTPGERTLIEPGATATVHYLVASHSDDGTWFTEVGVAVPLTKRLSLAPAYRYSQAFSGRTPVHLARLALRYSF